MVLLEPLKGCISFILSKNKMTHAEEALLDERRQRFQSEESVGGCVGECNFL